MIKAYDVATIRALEAQAIERGRRGHLDATGGPRPGGDRDPRVDQGERRCLRPAGPRPGRPRQQRGDALFAAARIAGRGASVTAVRCLGTPHQRGLAALRATGGRLLELDDLGLDDDVPPGIVTAADLVLDGVLGIGGRPGLPDDVGVLAGICERRGIPTIAVDLPSGVDADTGADPETSFKATRTVTFGELKPCHLLEPARTRCGEVDLVDIGLPDRDPRCSRPLAGPVRAPRPGDRLAVSRRHQRQVLPRRRGHRHRIGRLSRSRGDVGLWRCVRGRRDGPLPRRRGAGGPDPRPVAECGVLARPGPGSPARLGLG